MKQIVYWKRWSCGLFLVLTVASAAAEETKNAASPPAKNRVDIDSFIRVRRDEKKNPVAMETAIVHYVPTDPTRKNPTVDLVAAFHIGEKKYYEDLNNAFEKYDVVLYELVAPPGTRVPKGGGNRDSAVSKVQKFMKDTLELEFQLEQIDYTKRNFVHADMSADDIAKSMSENGESWLGVITRVMTYSMTQQSKGGDDSMVDLLFVLMSKNRALALKRNIADQLDWNGMLAALEGPGGSTLVSGRNKIALDVLKKQIAAGKRKIAVFYGGGHMPDMDQRLRADFNLVPAETRWLTAWDMKEKEAEKKK